MDESEHELLRKIKGLLVGVIVGFVVVFSALLWGFWSQHETSRHSCEFGNEFRRHDLPAAFAANNRRLGEALGATDAQIDKFNATVTVDLTREFPERKC